MADLQNSAEITINNNNIEITCVPENCYICDSHFSKDRHPKVLPCGHSICETCTIQSSTWLKRCAQCFHYYSVAESKNFPTNYPVLRYLESLKRQSSDMKKLIQKTNCFPEPSPLLDTVKDTWICSIHSSPMSYLCINCQAWICQDCLVVKHAVMPRGSCKVITIDKAIEKLKKKFNKEIRVCLGQIDIIKNNLEPEMEMLHFLEKHCPSVGVTNLVKITQRTDKLFHEHKKQDDVIVSTSKRKMKRTLSAVKNLSTSPEELSTLCKTLAGCLDKLKEYNTNGKERKKFLNQTITSNLIVQLKFLTLEARQPVFTSFTDSASRKCFGRIFEWNRRLFVSSLGEGSCPDNGVLVPYEYVRGSLPKNYPYVFMDIGTQDESHGIVVIKLFKDCYRVRNFVEFCSGDKDMYYKGSSLFKNPNANASFVYGGDLENNDGTGSNEDIDYNQDNCPTEKIKSSNWYLCFEYGSLTKFYFASTFVHNAMGLVTEGKDTLDILKAIDSPLSGFIIRECGFRIPRYIEED